MNNLLNLAYLSQNMNNLQYPKDFVNKLLEPFYMSV